MLSFLKGKKRRRSGRSKMGNNQSKGGESTKKELENDERISGISESSSAAAVDKSTSLDRESPGNKAESAVTRDELEHAPRINRSINSGSESNGREVDGIDDRRPSDKTRQTSADLEKSRRAFFLGLLEETVEEIYPEELILAQNANFDESGKTIEDVKAEFKNESFDGVDVEDGVYGDAPMTEIRSESVECDEEESGIGTSSFELSTSNGIDDRTTDSALAQDETQDLHTEMDEMSLEEFETCDNLADKVDDSEDAGGEIEEGSETENRGTGGGNDAKPFVVVVDGDDDQTKGAAGESDGRGGDFGIVEGSERRPRGSEGPVSCALSRDAHESTVEMLTVRNLAVETFPRSNVSLASSSDESIGAKVKKHVRWADTDDGRSLESYDSYSSCSSSSSSSEDEGDEGLGDEAEEVAQVADDAESGDESDVDESEPEADSSSDVDDEDKTGADDTLTVSDITVVNFDEAQDIDAPNEDCAEDEAENENAEETETDFKHEENSIETVARLQTELLTKAANLEKAQSKLDGAVLEADQARKKIERLKEDLDDYKRRHGELQRLYDEGTLGNDERLSLESRIKELEEELQLVRSDRSRLEGRLSALERERDHEINLVQQALEEALKEKATREARYQKEFEAERTFTSQRELQMLEDFEWKLRETEKSAKKKIEGAEVEATKRVHEMESRLARAEADLEKLAELKLCEIELKQLKATSGEQRRNLRQVTRQYEELQVNEKILQEEVNRLRVALDKEKQTVLHLQTIHKEEMAEKDRKLRVKLEVQCSQITSEWEDRLRQELSKLKADLEHTHSEEKIVAVDMVKHLKEQEISALKQGWEEKIKNFKQQVANLKAKLAESEALRIQEIENVQTSSDRDSMDLRRKMDKLDMEYQSKIEKMQEDHEAELSELKLDFEKKIVQMEAASQLQAGTTRTTIELVKQQLMNENQARIERLMASHRQQMEEQWETLEKERHNEVRTLEDRHRDALEHLRSELDEIRKAVAPSGKQSGRQRTPLPAAAKQLVLDQVNHEATNPLSGGDFDGIEGVSAGSDAEKILFAKLQQMVHQSNEDKAEIERLRQLIEQKEVEKPQQQQPPSQPQQKQNPPHPTRRNRKRRN